MAFSSLRKCRLAATSRLVGQATPPAKAPHSLGPTSSKCNQLGNSDPSWSAGRRCFAWGIEKTKGHSNTTKNGKWPLNIYWNRMISLVESTCIVVLSVYFPVLHLEGQTSAIYQKHLACQIDHFPLAKKELETRGVRNLGELPEKKSVRIWTLVHKPTSVITHLLVFVWLFQTKKTSVLQSSKQRNHFVFVCPTDVQAPCWSLGSVTFLRPWCRWTCPGGSECLGLPKHSFQRHSGNILPKKTPSKSIC